MRDYHCEGPESRRHHRRKKSDRREDIRFELGKEDRRQRSGRRVCDQDSWVGHTN